MKLSELIKDCNIRIKQGNPEINIRGVESNSKKVKDGYLFVAIKGFENDGHDCIQDALNRGAVAILAQREVPMPANISLLLASDTRSLEGILAARVYKMPSEGLKTVGITGTNGKGMISFLLKHIFDEEFGKKNSLIGTVENILMDEVYESKNTTPSASTVQYFLNETVNRGGKYMFMEASSHALSMGRLNGCEFDYAILTNITHEHLDYHKTMENYIASKMNLFKMLKPAGYAIINADLGVISDEFASINPDKTITYGIKNGDVRARDVEINRSGMRFTFSFHGESLGEINIPIIGDYNVYNALPAICVGLKEGIPFVRLKDILESFQGVEGRFEFIDTHTPFDVVVDFAHTPDALKKVIQSARNISDGRLIVVFGAGGESDKKKRPVMGNVVTSLADFAVITNDNPKREKPLDIIRSIEEGASEKDNWISIPDRRRAIEYALNMANPGDMVIVAGKGHEKTQIFDGYEIPFYDKDVILDILSPVLHS
ncbi:MAG: UDP-N-acetylmuramoyl-L-alanyl-D-glutamate--2,6-diaminopimelate ligase [Thermotogae bacterium]|nr:UDP-N-acetylmuramoyl-L-alanyl-D-glutamate--2,6-diaminopimelate ligase [Thermotogota bacterium]